MMSMRGSLRSYVFGAMLLVAGCGTATFVVQQYDGNPLPREQIALLRVNGGDPLRLETLDGERLSYQLRDPATRIHVELLPGVHELAVSDPDEGLPQTRRFRAQAGKVYRPGWVTELASSERGAGHRFVLFEVTRDTDTILLELPDLPPPKPRPKAPVAAASAVVSATVSAVTPAASAPQAGASETSPVASGTASAAPAPSTAPAPSAAF
jgi:hypothetical protein